MVRVTVDRAALGPHVEIVRKLGRRRPIAGMSPYTCLSMSSDLQGWAIRPVF